MAVVSPTEKTNPTLFIIVTVPLSGKTGLSRGTEIKSEETANTVGGRVGDGDLAV